MPGQATRQEALRRARGHILRLLLFAFPMLLVAALIESFVRQSGLSEPARYAFAAATAALWAVYILLARVPERMLLSLESRRTIAERAVPLPIDEEILPGFGPRAR